MTTEVDKLKLALARLQRKYGAQRAELIETKRRLDSLADTYELLRIRHNRIVFERYKKAVSA